MSFNFGLRTLQHYIHKFTHYILLDNLDKMAITFILENVWIINYSYDYSLINYSYDNSCNKWKHLHDSYTSIQSQVGFCRKCIPRLT